MVRHRLERLMRLTQGAALVAVAACTSNESKPGESITNEAHPVTTTAPSAVLPTINAVAIPPAASASAASSAENPPPAASASASASATAAPLPPGKPVPVHINATPTPKRVNSPRPLD